MICGQRLPRFSTFADLSPRRSPQCWCTGALTGILFVLYTGTAWEHLPYEVAWCSGMMYWRRLRLWQELVCGTVCTSICCSVCI